MATHALLTRPAPTTREPATRRAPARKAPRVDTSPFTDLAPRAPADALPPGIQAKLTIGDIDDPLEREADLLAEQVTSEAPLSSPTTASTPRIQRKCAGCSTKPCSTCSTEEDEPLQRKATGPTQPQPADGASFESRLRRATAGGHPLHHGTRSFMESRFGADFSGVRVHIDAPSAELAREIKAQAFTRGRDLFFGTGEYRPAEPAGRKLIAHELAHVLQQSAPASGVLRRRPKGPVADEALKELIHNRRTAPSGLDINTNLHSPEMWQCEVTTISEIPQMGSFYRLKNGDTLQKIVKNIFPTATKSQQLALAQVINDHPCNAKFHTTQGVGVQQFHGTRISYEKKFAEDTAAQSASLDGGNGARTAIIWIPNSLFREGPRNVLNSTGFENPRADAETSALVDPSCSSLPDTGGDGRPRLDHRRQIEEAWASARRAIKRAYAAFPREDLGGRPPSESIRSILASCFGITGGMRAPANVVFLREIRAKLSAMNSMAHAGNLTITCDDGTTSSVCGPTATARAEAQHEQIVVCARALQRQNCNLLMDDLIHEVAHFTFQTDDAMVPPPPDVTSIRAEDVVRAYETNVSSLGTALTTGMNTVNADSYRCYIVQVGEERIWCQPGGMTAVNPPTLAADPALSPEPQEQ